MIPATTADDDPGLGQVELMGGPADGLQLLTTAGPSDLLCLHALAEEFPTLHALRNFAIHRPHYLVRPEPERGEEGLRADYQQRPARPHVCGAGGGSTTTEENTP